MKQRTVSEVVKNVSIISVLPLIVVQKQKHLAEMIRITAVPKKKPAVMIPVIKPAILKVPRETEITTANVLVIYRKALNYFL